MSKNSKLFWLVVVLVVFWLMLSRKKAVAAWQGPIEPNVPGAPTIDYKIRIDDPTFPGDGAVIDVPVNTIGSSGGGDWPPDSGLRMGADGIASGGDASVGPIDARRI